MKSDGDYFGNHNEGRMMTEYGFQGADCPLMGVDTRWNIDHDSFELTIQDIKFRVKEMEKEEIENKDNHLTYQSLLKFFYDVRSIINTKETP